MISSESTTDAAVWQRTRRGLAPGAIRRIRQACTSCRHRKTKCSGERPICVNCRRINRVCQYEPYSQTNAASRSSSTGNNNATSRNITLFPDPGAGAEALDPELLRRINSIESQLAQLHGQSLINFNSSPDRPDQLSFLDSSIAEALQRMSPALIQAESPPSEPRLFTSVPKTSNSDTSAIFHFNTLPPHTVMQSLVDTYFIHVHNQPYSYFHEKSFRERLAVGQLPKCLVFAVLASSLRFSNLDYFRGSIREATEAYAREAWLSVLHDHMTAENCPNLCVAQTSNILAIIDFTSGRISSGWLKIGLAVRIAQDLQLMKEPKPSLPITEQEEQRRAFWSIYLLDKLVSCGQSRPLAIRDEDCHLQLPCDEETFRAGVWVETPRLHQVLDWNSPTGSAAVSGSFAQSILAASALGRCVRYALHECQRDEMPPWDPRSDFTLLNTFLFMIDHHLQVESTSISDVVSQYKRPDGSLDFQAMEHIIFGRVLFHLSYCLLNHPFLLRMRLKRWNCKAPPKFLARALEVSCDHARTITNIMETAATAGCHVQSSFYAYSSTLAGSIISLAIHIERERGNIPDAQLLTSCQQAIHILERMSRAWEHASKMHLQLMLFDANFQSLSTLVDISMTPEIDPKLEASLWLLVDYGAMSSTTGIEIGEGVIGSSDEGTFMSSLDQMGLPSGKNDLSTSIHEAIEDLTLTFLGTDGEFLL